MALSKNTMTDEEVKNVLMEVDHEKEIADQFAAYLTAEATGYGLKEALDAMPKKPKGAEKPE
jgi:hypothetical protein